MRGISLYDFCLVNDMQSLLDEWDESKNEMSPKEVSSGSARRVNWICDKGHTWMASIANRTKGSKCPYCTHRKVLPGFNDLATVSPTLLKDWDYMRNDIPPTEIMPSSNKKVWWKCHICGHEWQSTPNGRYSRNARCPECAKKNRRSHSSLKLERPDLLSDWDYSKNDNEWLNLLSTSKQRVSWKCHICGHEWQTTIYQRACSDTNCPACKGERGTLPWLERRHPELAKEWDYEANAPASPSTVTCGSDTLYGWVCPKGHHYRASIGNRVRNKSGCPYCAGKKLLQGFNDLRTLFPEVAKEWDRTKNKLGPEAYPAHSGSKVWWKCPVCKTSWEATIANRTGQNKTGCPICSSDNKVSMIEAGLYFYIEREFPDAEQSVRPSWLHSRELDIVIPSLRFAIEYDGCFFHTDITRDIWKSRTCQQHGLTLLHVREPGCPELPADCFYFQLDRAGWRAMQPALNGIASFLAKQYGLNVDFQCNPDRDRALIQKRWATSEKTNSLETMYPKIAREWNYEKNEGLVPSKFKAFSNQKVWWKCPVCAYEWESTINNRTSNSQGCPRCAKKKSAISRNNSLLERHGSLADTVPEVAAEWNYDRNGINPTEVTAGSGKQAWWKCPDCGNEWRTAINHRTGKKPTGCPRCGHNPLRLT